MKNLFSICQKILVIGLSSILISCNVYYGTPVNVEDALKTQKHVKIVTNKNKEYEFRRLEKMEGQLLGVTKKRSATAKRLKTAPVVVEGKIWKFELNENNIEFVYYRNEFQTKMVKIGFPIFLIGGFTIFVISEINDLDLNLGIGLF